MAVKEDTHYLGHVATTDVVNTDGALDRGIMPKFKKTLMCWLFTLLLLAIIDRSSIEQTCS